MKATINSTQDALAFLLQGLYFTETTIRETLPTCFAAISSDRIKDTFIGYAGSASNKLLKLERAFNYLMTEPLTRNNESIRQLVYEMHQVLSTAASPHLRDMLSIGYMQNINTYKISCYRFAYLFTVELELDVVADLVKQILNWELETSHVLSQLATEEFTRQQSCN
jgi:ferritin-like metal-binding protein YciE